MVSLIFLLPLFGSLINGIFGRNFSKKFVGFLGCTTVGISFIISIYTFITFKPHEINLFAWIISGKTLVNFSFLIDQLSVVMILVVTGVGFLIHVYSIGYMHEDKNYSRYFSYLNLFIFSMLILVLANNFILLYAGWELVGLCSYLLIGFWSYKDSAAKAGKKAFIVNRIGDFGFLLGILLLYSYIGSFNYKDVFDLAPKVFEHGGYIITLITLLLFMGAIGKSAQFPLHIWLPDAMEGPTPVSALIHAATMVTAGVFMVARCNVLFNLAPISCYIVVGIGAITAFIAATIAIFENDIKKVLAYSTISQLGYMFVAVGIGAYAVGIFHLVTHAFFKALLFLGAGSIMHALAGELDMNKMGNLSKYMPATCITFLIGGLALSGFPLFSGSVSKDEILVSAFTSEKGNLGLFIIASFTAFLTSIYIFRLIFKVFFGDPAKLGRAKIKSLHLHESPKIMTVPLIILASLSLIGGIINIPFIVGEHSTIEKFLEPVFKNSESEILHNHSIKIILEIIFGIIAISGIIVAYFKFVKSKKKEKEPKNIFYKIIKNKYYFDEIYSFFIIEPIYKLTVFAEKWFDLGTIDGIVNGVAKLTENTSLVLRKFQTGIVRNYILMIISGISLIIIYILFFKI